MTTDMIAAFALGGVLTWLALTLRQELRNREVLRRLVQEERTARRRAGKGTRLEVLRGGKD